jgi:hypothetical protein
MPRTRSTPNTQSSASPTAGDNASTTTYFWVMSWLTGDTYHGYWARRGDIPELYKLVHSEVFVTSGHEGEELVPSTRRQVSVDEQGVTQVSEVQALTDQHGGFHGKFAYVLSNTIVGVSGRPRWFLGQLDTAEKANGTGEAYIKDVSNGDEHEIRIELLDAGNCVLIDRAVAAFGVFDTTTSTTNSPESVRSVSADMYRRLRAGESEPRLVMASYIPPGMSERAIAIIINRTNLINKWFECDELGGSAELTRQEAVDALANPELGADHQQPETTQPPTVAEGAPRPAHYGDRRSTQPSEALATPNRYLQPSDRWRQEETNYVQPSIGGHPVNSGVPIPIGSIQLYREDAKESKHMYQPTPIDMMTASRLLDGKSVGKELSSIMCDWASSAAVQFIPYPKLLVSLFTGNIGDTGTSFLYFRPSSVSERADQSYSNTTDMTKFKGAVLPKLEKPQSFKDITDSLRGLNMFAQSEWSPLAKAFSTELLRFVDDLSFNAEQGNHDLILLTLWINKRFSEFIRCIRSTASDWGTQAASKFDRLSQSDPEYWRYALSALSAGRTPTDNGKRHANAQPAGRSQTAKRSNQNADGTWKRMSDIAPRNSAGKELCVMHLTSRGCPEFAKGKRSCGKGDVQRVHEHPSSVPKATAELIAEKLGGWAPGYSPKVTA